MAVKRKRKNLFPYRTLICKLRLKTRTLAEAPPKPSRRVSEASPSETRTLDLPVGRPPSLKHVPSPYPHVIFILSPCLETPSFSRPWPGRSGNMWNSLRIYHISPSDNTSSGVYVAQPIFDDCPCFVLIISPI